MWYFLRTPQYRDVASITNKSAISWRISPIVSPPNQTFGAEFRAMFKVLFNGGLRVVHGVNGRHNESVVWTHGIKTVAVLFDFDGFSVVVYACLVNVFHTQISFLIDFQALILRAWPRGCSPLYYIIDFDDFWTLGSFVILHKVLTKFLSIFALLFSFILCAGRRRARAKTVPFVPNTVQALFGCFLVKLHIALLLLHIPCFPFREVIGFL